MKYRKLGKHGVKISEISMGTMFYGSYVSKETGINCLNEAVNQGINLLTLQTFTGRLMKLI